MNKKMMIRFSIMGFAALSILASCGKGYGGGGGGYSTSPISTAVVEVDCATVVSTGTVNIQSSVFSPGIETIPLSGVVKWINNDNVVQTVTSGFPNAVDGKFDTTIVPGGTKCLKFMGAGTYNYFSRTFTSTTAQVIVQ